MSLLMIGDITAAYGKAIVLQNLSLRVAEGEICALLGSNGSGSDFALVLDAMNVVVPVGIGVVVGIVGVSNLLRWLLAHHAKPTLGALLGLLFGAVVGLWPFQQPVPPQPGDVIKGRVLTQAEIAEVEADDWRLERFSPTAGQVGVSLGRLR